MKKKMILLGLCLMMICTAFSALADYYAGDQVTISVSVSNPNGACAFNVGFSYDSSAFEFVSASGANGAYAGKNGFGYVGLSPFGGGSVGTATFRVKSGAVPGKTYSISATSKGAYDINDNSVSISVSTSGGSVTIAASVCVHVYSEKVTVPATCDQPGKATCTCTKCGDSYEKELPAKGHEYDEGKVTKQPTCKDEGIKTFTCKICDATKTEKIAKTDKHTWNEGVITKQPTCLVDGEKTFTCTVCNKTDVTVVKAAGQHTPGENTRVDKAPTCTENGKGSYQCAVCGEWIDNGVIPATGHDLKETVTAATCGKDGQKVSVCTKCDFSETTVIPATGKHAYDGGVVTTEPACGKEGEKTFTCSVCNHKKTEKIAALEHDYISHVTTEATCGKAGEKLFLCTRCGDTRTEAIPATGKHSYESKITVAPTCLEKGEKTFTCSVCGDHYAEPVPAKGHTPGSDLKQQDPTCSKPGYKYFTCTACGTQVKEDAIPATGVHIYEVTEETPATCTAKGKRVSACTYGCGKTKTETLKALGHKMGDWTVTTAPTCTEKGQQTRLCLNGCGKTETKAVSALGHTWGEWVITKPVTEKESGEKQRTCRTCGKVETQKISNRVDYHMTVCTEGIRFRDLKNPITKEWYMFTPIDLSVDGIQTFDLIAGNMHKIGQATVLVQDGYVTVTYQVNSPTEIFVSEEFMTILPSLDAVTKLDFDRMTNYAFGEPISIEETLGGDTQVLLLLRNRAAYSEDANGLERFNSKGKEYKNYVEELKKLMD
ncbi:MAG: hypothetical protein ACI4WX_14770 [Aristaeellaceae bacterium]